MESSGTSGSSALRASPRRDFLKKFSAWLAAGFVAPAVVTRAAVAAVPRATTASLLNRKPDVWPTYIPRDFTFLTRYLQRDDGFGGEDEVALWYQSLSAHNHPLAIYFTSSPQEKFFGLGSMERSETIRLPMSNGEVVVADYYDGIFSGRDWTRATAHSLVFAWQGLTFGIRGSRVSGVSRDELTRVANGLTL